MENPEYQATREYYGMPGKEKDSPVEAGRSASKKLYLVSSGGSGQVCQFHSALFNDLHILLYLMYINLKKGI